MQKTQDNVIMRPPSFEESELCIQHEPNPSSRGPHTGELHVLKRRKREGKNKKKKRREGSVPENEIIRGREWGEERSMAGALFVAVIVPTEKGPRFQGGSLSEIPNF